MTANLIKDENLLSFELEKVTFLYAPVFSAIKAKFTAGI